MSCDREKKVRMITWADMVSSRDQPLEGARGAQGTYRGGPEEGHRGDPAYRGVQRKDTGRTRPYREDPALQGGPGLPRRFWRGQIYLS